MKVLRHEFLYYELCTMNFSNRTVLSLIAGLVLSFVIVPFSESKTQSDDLSRIIAAFVYHISKFVTWPDSSSDSLNNPLKLCILAQGEASLLQQFSELRSKKAQGRTIQVIAFDNKQKLSRHIEVDGPCHILFASNGEWNEFTHSEIKRLRASTLLIGKSRHFLEGGGMMSLIQVESKIRIFLNPESMAQSQIKLESRLRSLARTL